MAPPLDSRLDSSKLAHYIDAASALFQLSSAERAELWLERLALHLPDFSRITSATCEHKIEPIGLPAHAKQHATAYMPVSADCRLSEIVRGVHSGIINPATRLELCLKQIDRHTHLNAFRHIDTEGARRLAADLHRRALAGQPLGPLAGIIVAVKDCIAVKGMPMTAGTRALPVETPASSASAVQSLQAADAIVIGITTMHELAYGATTDNPHFGRVGNPVDPSLIAGGSSGGSAVAVATGMADLALGTDSAGSVRMPASLCGIVGFKPSYEALSRQGVVPLSWSLDHIGLFTQTANDAAFVFQVMAGRPLAQNSETQYRPSQTAKKLRLKIPQNYFLDLVEPTVKHLFEAALDQLANAGATIEPVTIDSIELAPTMQFFTLCAEATQIHQDRALAHPSGLGDEVRVRLEGGQFLRAVDYIKAQRLRSSLREALSATLEDDAVLVTPTVLLPACVSTPFVNIQDQRIPIHAALTRCTLPFNLTGMPAISIPCGHTPAGLPVGLQIAGRFGDDAATLQAAIAIETVLRS